MSSAWPIKNLEEVLEIQNGYAFDSKGFNPNEGLPLVRIRSLKTGTENETMFSGDYDEKYIVNDGDLLIGMDGEFGCYEWRGGKALLNQRVCRLQGFKADLLLPRFLFYGVNTYLKAIEDVTGFATVKHISSKQILGIKFPLPPISEQQRIVAILDIAFDGIAKARANAEQNLQNARALFESHLQSVFTQHGDGWVESSLEDVVDEKCSLSYGIVQPGGEFENGLPIIRPTDLTSKYINLDGLKRINPDLAQSYSRTTLIGDELLLCVRGSTGVISIATEVLAGANVTRGIVPIRFKNNLISASFGYFLLTSGYVQEQIKSKTYGAALMQINIGDLRKIKVKYPSVKVQDELTVMLNELDNETQRLEALYQRKIACLDELKKSLLQQAFAGEL